MKALIISDLHHGHSVSDYHLENEKKVMEWIIDTIKKHNIKYVINLGDTHDKQTTANVRAVQIFEEYHKRISQLVEKYFIIAGNHDIYYKTSNSVTSLPLFFKEENQVLIEDKPLAFKNWMFIPWISDSNRDCVREFVRANNKSENYLFGHLESSGFRNGAITTKSDHLFYGEFDKYKHIYTGHYHEKQTSGNMTYVGTPFQKTFGELERKFIHVLNDDGELTSIENVNRQFEVIHLDDGLEETAVREKLADVENKKIRVHINSIDYEYISMIERILEEKSPHWYRILTQGMVHVDDDIEIENKSDEAINGEFLTRLQFNDEKYKKEFVKEFIETWNMTNEMD